MTHRNEPSRFTELVQVVATEGFDGMAQAMEIFLNEIMKIERSQALGAGSYERAQDHCARIPYGPKLPDSHSLSRWETPVATHD